MLSEGAQWITDPTVIIQFGDLYRMREDSHSDYCEWQSADHCAGMVGKAIEIDRIGRDGEGKEVNSGKE